MPPAGSPLAMKNCFGITPASIYGDDAGIDAPNESPTSGRVNVCHFGKRQPAKSSPSEIDQTSSRDPGYRMPASSPILPPHGPSTLAFYRRHRDCLRRRRSLDQRPENHQAGHPDSGYQCGHHRYRGHRFDGIRSSLAEGVARSRNVTTRCCSPNRWELVRQT